MVLRYVTNIITEVQLPDSCVRMVKHDSELSQMEARATCGRLGGVLASFTRAQHWIYVSRVLRYHINNDRLMIYMGLRTTPDHFPSM